MKSRLLKRIRNYHNGSRSGLFEEKIQGKLNLLLFFLYMYFLNGSGNQIYNFKKGENECNVKRTNVNKKFQQKIQIKQICDSIF